MSDPTAWGIASGYADYRDQWHAAPASTVAAALAAMGADGPVAPTGHGADNPVWVARVGGTIAVPGRWRLRTEDGAELAVEGSLPPGLAPGYHELVREDDGRRVRLILTPGTCFLPEGLRTWGWAVQLYAARSAASWGMGDLADLRRL
ncbi:MAG: 4-alpha-glucanotransferase, partial [Acidimicrobiales bacterium]